MKSNTITDLHALESVNDNDLAITVGGVNYWRGVKNSFKTAANAVVNYENAVLPERVTVGPASWDVGEIPKPYKDDPYKKVREARGF
jgi:hypothetical protein